MIVGLVGNNEGLRADFAQKMALEEGFLVKSCLNTAKNEIDTALDVIDGDPMGSARSANSAELIKLWKNYWNKAIKGFWMLKILSALTENDRKNGKIVIPDVSNLDEVRILKRLGAEIWKISSVSDVPDGCESIKNLIEIDKFNESEGYTIINRNIRV